MLISPLRLSSVGLRSFHTSSLVGRSFKERRYRFGREPTEFLEDGDVKVPGVSNKQYPLKVKWLRPSWIPRVTQSPEGSGDCEGLPQAPSDAIPVHLSGSSVLKSASPEVKDVVSLKYQRHAQACFHIQEDLLSRVRRHDYDVSSPSAAITMLTVRIRNHQKALLDISPKLNQARKHSLKILIDVRHHHLKALREVDYKQFEWLLEKLNIVYKERAPHEYIKRFEKTELITDIWCEELREYKLRNYRIQLEKEQPEFLREKAEFLRSTMEAEKELGISPPSVAQSQIDECLKEAERIEKDLKERSAVVDLSELKSTSQKL
uniref:Small ribosomal subunit protein uS15m n=1 Tax=Caligus rogercresseyi TaxID=217165 RepID=C1BR67_CALRO|nr:28S ribosomal protein S15, mitochondrial precursor [Caligus rogercresseyi]